MLRAWSQQFHVEVALSQATCRFRDLSFPHGGFWALEDANRGDVADDGGAASAAAAVFAAAPFVEDLHSACSQHLRFAVGNSPGKSEVSEFSSGAGAKAA